MHLLSNVNTIFSTKRCHVTFKTPSMSVCECVCVCVFRQHILSRRKRTRVINGRIMCTRGIHVFQSVQFRWSWWRCGGVDSRQPDVQFPTGNYVASSVSTSAGPTNDGRWSHGVTSAAVSTALWQVVNYFPKCYWWEPKSQFVTESRTWCLHRFSMTWDGNQVSNFLGN